MDNFNKVILFIPNTNLSGGPELFYQLGESLKNLELNAFVFFFGDGDSKKSRKRFSKYNVNFIEKFIDDEKNIIDVYQNFVEDKPFNSFFSQSLSESRVVLARESIDIIILDLGLPVYDESEKAQAAAKNSEKLNDILDKL